MKTPNAQAFKSGRQFAAWLGLTPEDHSTADERTLASAAKR
jgi:transposase